MSDTPDMEDNGMDYSADEIDIPQTYYAEVHFGNPRHTYEYKVAGSRSELELCDYAVVSRRDGFLDYKNVSSLQLVTVVKIKDTPNYAGKLAWVVGMISTQDYITRSTGGVANGR